MTPDVANMRIYTVTEIWRNVLFIASIVHVNLQVCVLSPQSRPRPSTSFPPRFGTELVSP